MNHQRLASLLLVLVLAFVLHSGGHFAIAGEPKGHSRHGSAFDTGLRQRPWRMYGIGHAPFPITTNVPEAQEWFNQGNALLHSFWWEEAERSFRWALKLDPECAMAYWGLARCGMHWLSGLGDHGTIQRNRDFLKEAVRRKHTVSERERLYIEAWEFAMQAEPPDRVTVLNKRLHELVLKYPDDVEAKSLLALFSIGSGNQLGTEMIVRDILAKYPEHPGAHHVRIHSWDGQFAEQAIPSCQAYLQIAPESGHANHMPGHIYAKVGMWHEAARAMDAATRVELRYMNDRLALPFETWNFAHNRDFLSYIQEQLGMAEASLHGTLDRQAGPLDPDRKGHYVGETSSQLRALVKFERWEEILKAETIKWRNDNVDKHHRAYVETLAYIGQNKTVDARARLGELK